MSPAQSSATALLVLGCTVGDGDPQFWAPSHDLGGGAVAGVAGQTMTGGAAGSAAGGASGAPGGGGAAGLGGAGGFGGSGNATSSGACTLHFDFTTVTYHGKYSPKNIGAVWVADGTGKFVKSLNVWASKRASNLLKWNAASGGNKVDAITAATATAHSPHSADWDCTNLSSQIVPDGPYKLMLEFTEEDSAKFIWPPGPSTAVAFVKGTGPVSVAPPNQANYVAMKLTVK